MKRFMCTMAAALLSTSVASVASAGMVNIVSDNANSTENLASFEGSLTYDAGLLTVVLKNTTSGVTSARLTGFVFNIDGNASASYIDSNDITTPNFNESAFDGVSNASASPFGTFDFGAALGGNFLGGGSPNSGIAIGDTGIFQFNITGADAGSLDVNDFFGTDGDETDFGFVARFRGIEPGGLSDKVPGMIRGSSHVIPLPPAAWSGLLTMGISAVMMGRNRLKALIA